MLHLRSSGRIVMCGRISQTAAESQFGVTNTGLLIGKRARMQGFIVSDYNGQYDEARQWISKKLKSGELKQRLHILDGLDAAPNALSMLFKSQNTGKLVVRVLDA